MKVNPSIFRGYDLRGVVGVDLTPEIVEHLGRAHGTYMKRHGITEAVVGCDFRETSPEYGAAIIKGLSWTGISVIDIGMHLVGTFYWAQYYLKCRGGVYVSASHNPKEYNGFKFAIDYSETLVSDGMQELRRMVEEEDYEQGEKPGAVERQDIKQAYFDDILKRVPITKKFKVVIDPSCSTAGVLAPELLRQVGCGVVECNTNLDPSFPLGHADPTDSVVAERLRKEVLENHADIGFSYDSDGDRIGIVDEKGGIIWNDVLVALFAIDVLHYHPGATIMYNLLCSKTVRETIEKYGGTPFMWRVGHSFLKKKNQEVKATFIGELSGHFFFSKDFYNHDDGLYSTLRVLSYLSRTGQTLSQAVASLPLYISSPEIKLGIPDDKKIDFIKQASPILKKENPHAEIVDDERAGDGLRLDLADGMFVIRYSQNGPYMTVKFESKTKEGYDTLKKYINAFLHRFPEIEWDNAGLNVNAEALQ